MFILLNNKKLQYNQHEQIYELKIKNLTKKKIIHILKKIGFRKP